MEVVEGGLVGEFAGCGVEHGVELEAKENEGAGGEDGDGQAEPGEAGRAGGFGDEKVGGDKGEGNEGESFEFAGDAWVMALAEFAVEKLVAYGDDARRVEGEATPLERETNEYDHAEERDREFFGSVPWHGGLVLEVAVRVRPA